MFEIKGVCSIFKFFTSAQQPAVVQGLLIIEDSQSYSDKPHSVGLLLKSDQLVPENST